MPLKLLHWNLITDSRHFQKSSDNIHKSQQKQERKLLQVSNVLIYFNLFNKNQVFRINFFPLNNDTKILLPLIKKKYYSWIWGSTHIKYPTPLFPLLQSIFPLILGLLKAWNTDWEETLTLPTPLFPFNNPSFYWPLSKHEIQLYLDIKR